MLRVMAPLRCAAPVTTILVLAVCGVLAGARSFTAITEWISDTAPQVLPALGIDGGPPNESTPRGHGRGEKGVLKAVSISAGILFPHAVQAIQITRESRKLSSRTWRTETVYAVTSLTTRQAQPNQLATWIRGHWYVENSPPLGP